MSHDEQLMQITTFRLADEWYGVDVLGVQEIMRPVAIDAVPLAPDQVCGLINVRGLIVTCLSLKHLLACDDTSYEKGHRFVIVRDPVDNGLVCLLVDEVGDVLEIDRDQISDAPPAAVSRCGGCLIGLSKVDRLLVSLLDIEQLLAIGA